MADRVKTCALCRTATDLRDGHLLPKALYRLVRGGSGTNPNPVLIGYKRKAQTSRQVTARLLCGQCEQLFNRNGEDWVLKNCYRGRGIFRLRTMLESMQPVEAGPEARAYAAAANPNVAVEKLAYFAASVFWRASLQKWDVAGHKHEPTRLGPYQQEFRAYLSGQSAFPEHASLTLVLSQLKHPVLAWNFPDSIHIDSGYCHRLHIPGMTFLMAVGKLAAVAWEPICLVRSVPRLIYIAKFGDALVQTELLALMGKIRTPRPYDNVVEGYEHLLGSTE